MSNNTMAVYGGFAVLIVLTLIVAAIVVHHGTRRERSTMQRGGAHRRRPRPQAQRAPRLTPEQLADPAVYFAIFATIATHPDMDDLTRTYVRVLTEGPGAPSTEEKA